MYLIVDGDSVGYMMTNIYLSNDEDRLKYLTLKIDSMNQFMSESFVEMGAVILVCAADGLVSSFSSVEDITDILNVLMNASDSELSFSGGLGDSLKDAYLALKYAKSSGKKCLSTYSDNIFSVYEYAAT